MDLVQYLGKGWSFADTKILRDEVNGKRTREGGLENELKKNFFDGVKPSFVRTEYGGVVKDPREVYNWYKFQQAVLTYIEVERKNGKSVTALFDPKSKDYVGKLVDSFKSAGTAGMRPSTGLLAKEIETDMTQTTAPEGDTQNSIPLWDQEGAAIMNQTGQ